MMKVEAEHLSNFVSGCGKVTLGLSSHIPLNPKSSRTIDTKDEMVYETLVARGVVESWC